MNKRDLTRDQKEKQIRREARATFLLFVICFVWNVGFAYGLSGVPVRVLGLPLWWMVSVPGVFVVAVIGVVYLLKKVFVDFDLDDGAARAGRVNEEGGAEDAE